MKKFVKLFALFLMSVFFTSCGQNQTNVPKDNIKSETKDIVTSYGPNTMVRNIKKGRNGTILIAASFAGVFRYDGKSFTNLTSKIGSHSFWDVLEDRKGNLWFASSDSGVYYYNGKSFQHFTTKEGLANNRVMSIYEDRAGNIWFGTEVEQAVTMGNLFEILQQKMDFPVTVFTTIIEDKTGKLWFGTRGEACCL